MPLEARFYNSNREKVRRLRELIKNYTDYDSKNAEVELSQIENITGEDLIEALQYIETFAHKYSETLERVEDLEKTIIQTKKEMEQNLGKKLLEKKAKSSKE